MKPERVLRQVAIRRAKAPAGAVEAAQQQADERIDVVQRSPCHREGAARVIPDVVALAELPVAAHLDRVLAAGLRQRRRHVPGLVGRRGLRICSTAANGAEIPEIHHRHAEVGRIEGTGIDPEARRIDLVVDVERQGDPVVAQSGLEQRVRR
jgi:hypothetical protein